MRAGGEREGHTDGGEKYGKADDVSAEKHVVCLPTADRDGGK
jgi:hypothetical protein